MMELTEKNRGEYSSELHSWIDSISFSKPKRNLTRDFSDAVLMAEILKVYYPRYVDLHNYIPANSVRLKKDNWDTLNRRVLSKIDMKLSKETIDQLANAQRGIIEKVLTDLRVKLSKDGLCVQQSACDIKMIAESNVLDTEKQSMLEDTNEDNHIMEQSKENEANTETNFSTNTRLVNWKNSILLVAKWMFSWIFIWNYFLKIFNKTEGNNSTAIHPKKNDWKDLDVNVSMPFLIHTQLKQELCEKIDMISTLNKKVADLENAMKLPEQRSLKETDGTGMPHIQDTPQRDTCPKEEISIVSFSSKIPLQSLKHESAK